MVPRPMGVGSYTYVGGAPRDTVEFTINGAVYTVTDEVPPETSLNVFIRDHALLRGTKSMCHEGGCGACIVAAEINGETLAVNSCLVPVLICNGWKIKTVEGIGNRKMGYHKIQAALAGMNGSQCGYCSAGMVMNMYSLTQDKSVTMKEVENSFGSNICRCTGYRPILDAFKSMASDADQAMTQKIQDIEEIYKVKKCNKSCKSCKSDCSKITELSIVEAVSMEFGEVKFQKVLDMEGLFTIFANHPNESYVLNGGNTAHGVYRLKKPQLYIDLNDIMDLRRVEKTSDSLILGGNVTLTVIHKTFMKYCEEPGFQHLRQMANHVDLIASIPIRNIGTMAGNLMIKHKYNEFPSDLWLILETAGAEIHILESPGNKNVVNFMDFLKMDMHHKIIYSVLIPALTPDHIYRTYKIMPRAQNAHAHVNAGFLFKIDAAGKVLEKPNILFGGIRPNFLHATATEEFLTGKAVLDKAVFKQALDILTQELDPNHVLPDYSPEFRKTLAQGLFYKFVLSLRPDDRDERIRSGGTMFERGLSSGKFDYTTDESTWPVSKPLPKTESIYQTSGEAQYITDIPLHPHEVHCAFVTTEVHGGKISNIDASEALKMKGVVAFLTAKDVPGKNLFADAACGIVFFFANEPLFVDEVIEYAGQPVGVICADTHAIAQEAAKKVKVTYTDVPDKPVITIDDAIATGDEERVIEALEYPANGEGENPIAKVLKGTFNCGPQYHFTMEPQCCVCVPTEDGMDVYPSTQFMDYTQVSIANCLGITENKVNINVRRLGGSYGSKISRSAIVNCACAVVAQVLNRPARFVMSIESNMTTIGKRFAVKHSYDCGVDADGLIQYLDQKTWHNVGSSLNDPVSFMSLAHAYSCYDPATWNSVDYSCKTDVPSNTYTRGPGSVEGIAMTENLMEHIAHELGKDPLEVRIKNMGEDHREHISEMIKEIKETSDYEARVEAVNMFNKDNRWKKRGISLIPMMYPLNIFGQWNVLLTVYPRDGTVSVVHGGVECGQGINTKLSQVIAHCLGIEIDMISVKPSNNLVTPGNFVTGASISTECVAKAAMTACEVIMTRLEPFKKKMKNATWPELCTEASASDVNLCVQQMITPDVMEGYSIYGVTVSEVEIDLLTGQHLIRRIDLHEDVGISMNPEIDRGQVEGAFIMGIGYWTSEDLTYCPKTGQLVNNRTWNYKPPGAKDIPVDFRIVFRKNKPNPAGVYRSKAVGEPPLCMSYGIIIAMRYALNSARKDAGHNSDWYEFDGPATNEKILMTSLTNKDMMIL